MKKKCDIFCCVVDNFGDIGVTWRLAKQLASEYEMSVQLWIDEFNAFAKINPHVDVTQDYFICEGVIITKWTMKNILSYHRVNIDLLIEAFACNIPHDYIIRLTHPKKILWLNLDYLSAEKWIEPLHGMQSLQDNKLNKFFYFPGFTMKTGGVIYERNLFEKINCFQRNLFQKKYFFSKLSLDFHQDEIYVSLFIYQHVNLDEWLDYLSQQNQKTCLLVSDSQIIPKIESWLGCSLRLNEINAIESLRIIKIPFLSQELYDQLLWSCDINFVRGEDSFIRAIWAKIPFIWHIYPQDKALHLKKLKSFLSLYQNQFTNEKTGRLISQLFEKFNKNEDFCNEWRSLQDQLIEWKSQNELLVNHLMKQPSLSERLMMFFDDYIENKF